VPLCPERPQVRSATLLTTLLENNKGRLGKPAAADPGGAQEEEEGDEEEDALPAQEPSDAQPPMLQFEVGWASCGAMAGCLHCMTRVGQIRAPAAHLGTNAMRAVLSQ